MTGVLLQEHLFLLSTQDSSVYAGKMRRQRVNETKRTHYRVGFNLLFKVIVSAQQFQEIVKSVKQALSNKKNLLYLELITSKTKAKAWHGP